MRTRRGEQLSPLHFDSEIEEIARKIRARRRLNTMSFSHVSSSTVSVAQEPSGEATGMSFIPPISEFQFRSTSASGGAVSAPVPIPSCTPPSIPPFPPVSQPQSTNPFTSTMSWGEPTRDGTPVSRQQTPISQPQPILFKPQTTFQPTQPQQHQQPPQPQYQYPEAEERYDEEDEGWGYNDPQCYGYPAQLLYFAQPRGQSVASHFQPQEYDDSSPIYIPDDVEHHVEIRPQLIGILTQFRGYKTDDPYNHLYAFLAVANANTPRNANRDAFRLRLFPFTLKDKAKYWFTSLPSNSITSWDQLKVKFLQEFYPASKTTEIRRVIQDFQQKAGEAFHEAFDRLKELLRSCPHHEVPKWQLVKLFFEGVSETHQAMINVSSSGTFMWQDLEEAWQFLEQLSNGSKANFSTRKTVGTAAAVGADADWKKERQNNYQGQSSNQPRSYQPTSNNGNASGSGSNNNNRGPNTAVNNAPGTQEDLVAKMYEMFSATQLQSQANAKAIANMERQIGQMAEDQRKRDNGKLPSATGVNPTHNQRAGKEHVNTVETEWRKVTLEDLLDSVSEVEPEKEEKIQEKEENKGESEKGMEEKEIPVEEGTQPEVDKEIPTPDTVRLTIKASEALLGTLPKKEKDPGSPLITTTVGDVVIRNTLLDLGASVNVLPGYLYDKYKNKELEPAKVVLQLADQSTKVSRGKLTNVIVKVGDFFYPVDFLVMEYESLDDAPALILGRPFLATAGAVIDCKTGDVDISFGTRKRRLNVFSNPVSLPSGDDDKQLDKSVLMEPGIRNKGKIWTRTGEGGKEEILKETKDHPLATIDKEQLLDMMEMLEARHQQYEKESKEREAKVFKLLESQQQWISGVSDRMTQLTSLMSPRRGRIRLGIPRLAEDVKLSACWEATHRVIDDVQTRPRVPSVPRGPASSVEYRSRRDALTGRRVLEATIIDTDILRGAGLWGEIEPFYTAPGPMGTLHLPVGAGIGSWPSRRTFSTRNFYWSSFLRSSLHLERQIPVPG
ncbi:hypothetical protein L2E82_16453 [Cichorium intybus]|uniref:Uncharacterized protein n=1 Tax=Cichorium intybus TaxID=13427 RepID=A0ACB9F671_CICIN|nr:hypothetical protein L2E82_16453 [Cichorium intybus]